MILQDENLSYRARGIAAYILANPDAIITVEYIRHKGSEGREAVRTALKELADAGYLVREKVKNEKGHFVYKATLHD